VPASIAKFLEEHKVSSAASLWAACDNYCAKVGLDALKRCAIYRSWVTTPESLLPSKAMAPPPPDLPDNEEAFLDELADYHERRGYVPFLKSSQLNEVLLTAQ